MRLGLAGGAAAPSHAAGAGASTNLHSLIARGAASDSGRSGLARPRVDRTPPQLRQRADRLGGVAALENDLARDVVLDHREQRLRRQARRDVARCDAALLI